MASDDVMVGKFVPFEGDVEAAVITGEQVEACVRSFDDDTARANRSLMDLFATVEEIELSVRVVAASKSGALALRRFSGEIDDSVIETIGALDNNNAIFVGEATRVRVV